MIDCPNLIFQNIAFVFNTIAWKNGEFQEARMSVSAELKKKSEAVCSLSLILFAFNHSHPFAYPLLYFDPRSIDLTE